MDRKKLIDLFQRGMEYPPGKRRFWISRCFEINVRPDSVVELDEYEGFSTQEGKEEGASASGAVQTPEEMFHVGRSVLYLRDGRVHEESGGGWRAGGEEKSS